MRGCNEPSIVPVSARPTLLIIGCGDIGLRVLHLLRGRMPIIALTSSAQRRAELRAAGARPVLGNLDEPSTLGRLGGLADWVPPTKRAQRSSASTNDDVASTGRSPSANVSAGDSVAVVSPTM